MTLRVCVRARLALVFARLSDFWPTSRLELRSVKKVIKQLYISISTFFCVSRPVHVLTEGRPRESGAVYN